MNIDIPTNNKWSKSVNEKANIRYFDMGNNEEDKQSEFIMQQQIEKEKKNNIPSSRASFRYSKLELEKNKSHEEETINTKEEEKKESDDEDSEKYEIYEKEGDIIKEVTGKKLEKMQDDKKLTEYVINLMINKKKAKNSDVIKLPEFLEENDELNSKLCTYSKLSEDLKDT